MNHFILYVRDQARSTAYYRAVLAQEPQLNVPGMTRVQAFCGNNTRADAVGRD
jgi:catechol 2,3-dioxygenase-like lactoylglutathione lyase family enzyme